MSYGFMGERFVAVYHLMGSEADARTQAQDICLEQTVELPESLVTQDYIREHVFGQIEEFAQVRDHVYEARISFAVEISANELTQLLNVLFGNISLKPGIRLERFELPPTLLEKFHGTRFGRGGLR
jgi:ribulose-bisphosphate carboxylase large chain